MAVSKDVSARVAQVGNGSGGAELEGLLRRLPPGDDVGRRARDVLGEAGAAPLLPRLATMCRSWLLARIMLLQSVAAVSATPSGDIRFILLERSHFGQPLTHRYAPPTFSHSLSHTNEWVCCATSACGRVGADIVSLSTSDNPDFWKAAFTASEWSVLTLNRDDVAATFAFFWSTKEAVLKALGYGFANAHIEPRDIEIRVDSPLSEEALQDMSMALPLWIKGQETRGWAARFCLLVDESTQSPPQHATKSLLTVVFSHSENEALSLESLSGHYQLSCE